MRGAAWMSEWIFLAGARDHHPMHRFTAARIVSAGCTASPRSLCVRVQVLSSESSSLGARRAGATSNTSKSKATLCCKDVCVRAEL